MNNEIELAYLGIEVADPEAFGTFLGEIVGLVAGDRTTDGNQTWRNDDRAQRIIVQEGPANDAVFVGFEESTSQLERASAETTSPVETGCTPLMYSPMVR